MINNQRAESADEDAVVILRRACLGEDDAAEADGRTYADMARSSAAIGVSVWRTSGSSSSLFVISRWAESAGAKGFLRNIAEGVAAPVDLLNDGCELRVVSAAGVAILHGLLLTAFAQSSAPRI